MMKSVLVDKGIAEDKIVSLGIFDYLIPILKKTGQTKDQPMIACVIHLLAILTHFLQNLPIISMVLAFDETRALCK